MLGMLRFHQLFRSVSAQNIEYSFGEAEDVVTTMIPLRPDFWSDIEGLSRELPFAGQWAWSVRRFSTAVDPDAFLFRVDWARAEPVALTLYCRFRSEPGPDAFAAAMAHASPFRWTGPAVDGLSAAVQTAGPRGIAFRVSKHGTLRSALYFRSDLHAGSGWTERLVALVAACGYPEELSETAEDHLKTLYQPGPVGVIGIDNGDEGVAGALKFDPANVPLPAAYACLARVGVSEARIAAFKRFSLGLRAEAATYLGVQFNPKGLSGWRLYFACEPPKFRLPARAVIATQQYLRPVRSLPHY